MFLLLCRYLRCSCIPDGELPLLCHHTVYADRGHAVSAGHNHAVEADDRNVLISGSENNNSKGLWCLSSRR